MSTDMAGVAGVVLAGGRSARMGASKAGLAWHGSTLLRRVTGILGRAVDGPVVVVAAKGQPLPPLEEHVLVRLDPQIGLGPLQGLAVGLAAVADDAATAFVCATDLPFLHPAFVRAVMDALPADQSDGPQVALPVLGGYRQPTAAGYRTDLAPLIQHLVDQRRLRLARMIGQLRVRELGERELAGDPALGDIETAVRSVRNVNTTQEYAAALALPQPLIHVTVHPKQRGAGAPHGAIAVRASTVAGAAQAVDVLPAAITAVTLNGASCPAHEELPLVDGDVLAVWWTCAR